MPLPSPSSVLLRTQSDERLVVLARAGHERAFEAIVERYRGGLLRVARRYLPEARAEDAVQQAFLAAWSALQRGDDVRDLGAWLHRIARNSALNQLRATGYDCAELEESVRAADAPPDALERRATMRQTLIGLAALPERQREALLRIAVEGCSRTRWRASWGSPPARCASSSTARGTRCARPPPPWCRCPWRPGWRAEEWRPPRRPAAPERPRCWPRAPPSCSRRASRQRP